MWCQAITLLGKETQKKKLPCFWLLLYLVKGFIGSSYYGIGQYLMDRTNVEQTTKNVFMLAISPVCFDYFS